MGNSDAMLLELKCVSLFIGLSEANSFKIKFDHSNPYTLDSVMGERDVKTLKPGVPEALFLSL